MTPLNENFGLGIGEDPIENTDQMIYGEVNYKNFVESYKPNALITGNYGIIQSIRDSRLLTVTADSGLLEALEAKGITLSQVEKLLPLIDELGVLPIVAKNKDLLVSLAPLLIEPAPVLLPIVAGILNTPAATFQFPGFALLAAAAVEFGDNGFLAVVLALLGVPLAGLGTVLGSLGGLKSLPSATSYSTASSVSTSSFKAEKGPSTRIKSGAKVSNNRDGGDRNGKRKLIKINAR